MIKNRAQEILHRELLKVLLSTSKVELDSSLLKVAGLADILDQAGNENLANRIDVLLKEAGFWSGFLSGMSGGVGEDLWNAFKTGKFKAGMTGVVKHALMTGASGVVVEYLIKWLDGLPLIGGILEELGGAPKLKSMLEAYIGSAIVDSDLADKLVDRAIEAVEEMIGIKKQQAVTKPDTTVKPGETHSDTKTFQVTSPDVVKPVG